jgi:hypothetical protein
MQTQLERLEPRILIDGRTARAIRSEVQPFCVGDARDAGRCWAFVAAGNEGVRVVDIRDPTRPGALATHDTPDAVFDVAATDTRVFALERDQGVRVLERSCVPVVDVPVEPPIPGVVDPACDAPPALAGSVSAGSRTYSLAVEADLAAVGLAAELLVVDLRDPGAPSVSGSLALDAPVRAMTIAGGHAYVSSGSDFYVVDVGDPAAPTVVARLESCASCTAAIVWGSYVVLAHLEGFIIVDVSDPRSPAIAAHGSEVFFGSPNPRDIARSGSLALFADTNLGLRVLDLADPSAPVVLRSAEIEGGARHVAVLDDLVVLTHGDLRVADVSDRGSPSVVGSLETPGDAHGLALAGTVAIVADGAAGLQLVDLSDPTAPVIVATVGGLDTTRDVALAGALAVVITSDPEGHVHVVDLGCWAP